MNKNRQTKLRRNVTYHVLRQVSIPSQVHCFNCGSQFNISEIDGWAPLCLACYKDNIDKISRTFETVEGCNDDADDGTI